MVISKKFQTKSSKIAQLKKKNNSVVFKTPVVQGGRRNLIVEKFKQDKVTGKVKIEGEFGDTKTFKNIDSMVKEVDWKFMRRRGR